MNKRTEQFQADLQDDQLVAVAELAHEAVAMGRDSGYRHWHQQIRKSACSALMIFRVVWYVLNFDDTGPGNWLIGVVLRELQRAGYQAGRCEETSYHGKPQLCTTPPFCPAYVMGVKSDMPVKAGDLVIIHERSARTVTPMLSRTTFISADPRVPIAR